MIDYRKENTYKIYIHISPSNKYYVGVTCQKYNQRWRNGEGYSYNTHFYRAIKKYGWDNFEHFIFAENLTRKEACNMEIKLIKELKSNNYNYGYNICSGGEGATGLFGEKNPNYGHKWSNEQRNKMSKYKKEHPVRISEQGRLNKSTYMKRKWEDENYRKSMSGKNSPCYGRVGVLHPMYGKHDKEHPYSKPVICINTKCVYQSAMNAHIKTGANHSKLCMCCRGERKSCGKDSNGKPLYWMYYSDYLKKNNINDEEARTSLFFVE